MMILGHYMLLNLFLAILLKFISENSDDDHECGHHDEVAATPRTLGGKADEGVKGLGDGK